MKINIDISEDITLAFIAAILGIAFPIIIQTISGIDAKYGSTRLVRRIERSWKYKFLYSMLIVAVITRLYYCFAPPRTIDYGNLNPFIEKSAILLCIAATCLLIVSLFCFISEIRTFYKPFKLLESIKKNIKSYSKSGKISISDDMGTKSITSKETPDKTLFWDLEDLSIYIVNSKNENTVYQLFLSMHEIAEIVKRQDNDKYVNFPYLFYNLIYSINHAICQQKRQFCSILNNNPTSILTDSIYISRISPNTYLYIWLCLGEQLFYKRTDLIFQYWTYAYQHYTLILKRRLYEGEILNEGIKEYEHTVTAEDVKNRENDKAKFRLFNVTLCAHLLYKKQYALLTNILQYRNATIPISEPLLPDSYPEIIDMHIEVSRIKNTMPLFLTQQFPFIDMQQGAYNDYLIKSWIDKFLFVLMLWTELANQDSCNAYKLDMPNIPKTIADNQVMQRSITNILKIADDVIEGINIGKIYHDLPSKSDIVINKLKSYMTELQHAQETQEVEQKTDPDLVDEFYTSAKDAVTEFKDTLNTICNEVDLSSANKVQIGFQYDNIQNKSVYCKDQGYSRGNFAEATKRFIVHNLYYGLYKALSGNANTTEVCMRTDMMEILGQLQLDNRHIIIASSSDYGQWFDKIESKLKKETSIKYMYSETPFLKLNLRIPGTCIWILQSKELIGYTSGNTPFNSDFSTKMAKIDDAIFAGIIDLHGQEDIVKKLKTKDDLKYDYNKYVLELLDVNIELILAEHPHILQIILTDQWSRTPYTVWQKVKTYNEYSA